MSCSYPRGVGQSLTAKCLCCDAGPWPPHCWCRAPLAIRACLSLQGQSPRVLLVMQGGLRCLPEFHRFLVSWAAVGERGTRVLSFSFFVFAGGILGALFNALNYWLTMFRIR